MSRIGKLPITVPAGVEVKISDTNERCLNSTQRS